MEAQSILESIQNVFKEQGYVQVSGYNRFGYVGETNSALIVSRETGQDTRVPLSKILQGIEAVQDDINVYNGGPSKLRNCGITHITSPIWSLLHLVPKTVY